MQIEAVVGNADRVHDRIHIGGCGARGGRVVEVGNERLRSRAGSLECGAVARDRADTMTTCREFEGGGGTDRTGSAENRDIHGVNLLNNVH